MEFQGFRSVSEYERECSRLGYSTRRESFTNGNENCFALITSARTSPSAVESWHLISEDETHEIMNGIIDDIDANFLGKLEDAGYKRV